MQESITISHTDLETVSGKFYAYHNLGKFEITPAQKLILDWDLCRGAITMTTRDYNAMNCEKITF